MRILLGALLLFLSSVVYGQYQAEEFQAALLQAKYGALLVYNGQKNSFTIKFVAKTFEPTDKDNFVRVDDYLMSSTIIPFIDKVDFNAMTRVTQQEFLTAWKKYEKEWVEEQLKTKIKEKEEFMEMNGRPFLYWVFDMPKSDDPYAVDKQIHLVTACFDQMLILSGPLEKNKSEAVLRDKLVGIAKSLELYPARTQDINKLYHDLLK